MADMTASMQASLCGLARKLTRRRQKLDKSTISSPRCTLPVSVAEMLMERPPTFFERPHQPAVTHLTVPHATLPDPSSTSDSQASREQDHRCGLLDLPDELWSLICNYVLADRYPKDRCLYEGLSKYVLRASTRLPPLASTCSVVRGECLRLLSTSSSVLFLLIEADFASPNWRMWLEAMAPDTRRTLQRRLYITSNSQDLVPHLKRSGLMPLDAEFGFEEPEGVKPELLRDFTYKVSFTESSVEALERAGSRF